MRAVRDKSFTVSDEYTLSEELGKNLKLLSTGTDLCVDEVKGVGSKLIVKARAETNAVFLNVDGGALFSTRFTTAFTQIIEAEATGESFADTVHLQLRDAEFTCLPGREGAFAVSAQLYLTAQAVRRENCVRTYVADAYSNDFALRLSTERMRAEICPEQRELRFDMTRSVSVSKPTGLGRRLSTKRISSLISSFSWINPSLSVCSMLSVTPNHSTTVKMIVRIPMPKQ